MSAGSTPAPTSLAAFSTPSPTPSNLPSKVQISGWVGLGASFMVLLVVLRFCYRAHRNRLVGNDKGRGLRAAVRLSILAFILLDTPHFFTIASLHDDFNDGDMYRIFYALHLLGQSCIYAAFCWFGLLWSEILNLFGRWKRASVLVAGGVALGYFLFTLLVVYCIVIKQADRPFSEPIYKAFYYGSAISLCMASALFLGVGLYVQGTLHSWFVTNTPWQRAVMCRLNAVVALCTMFSLMRALMLLLLYLEFTGSLSTNFFTNPNDPHPIAWLIFSQILPNTGLSCVLLYMTDASPPQHVRTNTLDDDSDGRRWLSSPGIRNSSFSAGSFFGGGGNSPGLLGDTPPSFYRPLTFPTADSETDVPQALV